MDKLGGNDIGHCVRIGLLTTISVLSACAPHNTQPAEPVQMLESALVEVQVPKPVYVPRLPSAVDISGLRDGFQFVAKSDGRETEVAYWISYDPSERHHVAWRHGGEWTQSASERVLIDPVNRTLALGFDESTAKHFVCQTNDGLPAREQVGYVPCNSRFAKLSVVEGFEAESLRSVSLNAHEVAKVAHQLGLFEDAQAVVSGEKIDVGSRQKRLLKNLKRASWSYAGSLKLLQEKRIQQYRQGVVDKPINVEYSYIDRSGYYAYDLQPKQAIRLIAKPLDVESISYQAFVDKFLQQGVTDALIPVSSLLHSQMKSAYLADKARLESRMNEALSAYGVECAYGSELQAYQVVITCPEQVSSEGEGIHVPVRIEVNARTFGVTVPVYSNHNNDLSVVSDRDAFKLTNNTGHGLTVDRIEVTINDIVDALLVDRNPVSELAPGQTAILSMDQILSDKIREALNVGYISRREAVRQSVVYGVSVHYQSEASEQSLRLTNIVRYRLSELLPAR